MLPWRTNESEWEVELDGKWSQFSTEGCLFVVSDTEIRFDARGSQYLATFMSPTTGIQENLQTGRQRRLRRAGASAMPTHGLQKRTNDIQRLENLAMLRRELLAKYPQATEETHTAHGMLKRAQKAEDEGRWETAFNELLDAEDALRRDSEARITEQAIAGSSSSSAQYKRSASSALSEVLGEPRRVVRRLLKEANGDENEAVNRAFTIRDLEQGTNSQIRLNQTPVECSICVDNFESREAVRLWPCQHGWYCLNCFRRAADAKMDEGAMLGSIGCPECRRGLSEVVLRALLSKEQMERLHRLSLESAVASSDALRPCPTPDCPNRVAVEVGMVPRLNCELCHKEHCLLCGASPYHTGKTCAEHLASASDASSEKSLREWMAEVGAKQCPQCKSVVTKQNLRNQGTQRSECHKMICRTCRTKFCFKCLAVLTATYTCGCTADNHGFLDPDTGDFVQHLVGESKHGRRRR